MEQVQTTSSAVSALQQRVLELESSQSTRAEGALATLESRVVLCFWLIALALLFGIAALAGA
jgi:hypothetical protein